MLNLANVLRPLAAQANQMALRQMNNPAHPLHGAYISPDHELDESGHGGTCKYIATCGLLVAASITHPRDVPPQLDRAVLLHRMDSALDYLLRVQRPSGLIDLRSANYDSAPDTAFAVQLLCAMLEVSLPAADDPQLAAIMEKTEVFIRKAVGGILTGGFHTPNHRWVIVSALAQAAALFPDLAVQDVIRAYVAEGFDVDAEGAYLERSVGVYDAVTNRSLLLLADYWDNPADCDSARAAVSANLNFDLHLLHGDGSAETGLSRRQDYGTRAVPASLIANLLHASVGVPTPEYLAAAEYLYQRSADKPHFWTAYILLKFGEVPETAPALPADYIRFYPVNKLWRLRRDDLSVSVFGDTTRLLTLTYGAAELSSIKIAQTYHGVGLFVGDEITAEDDTVTLHSRGDHNPYRPAYELPLGRPVPPDQWEAAKAQRQLNWQPRADNVLSVTAADGGIDLHFRTLDGVDDVTGEIALDFPAGGIWETDDTALYTRPGQVIFLRRGYGRMRFGDDVIEIGPGSDAHRTWTMRHSEPVAPGHMRLLLPYLTPADHRFRVRVFRGLQP